ncbi:polysaccharide deacetylase family protein [Helicobacter sp. MIT 21-1697]|uniref:polysaccharide deacetylase family protein n=1 Tax=Helicobacter sp. MIT 21-1697 TaxID=2993733 RepID=UPI00224A6D02|nr:polysaccharide deacetylase family protein [Helicobacter sp. MIT 21-1697]MCX2717512.1 polysaccharide deacetylase family protein [Helicobacter sp. MIT 21-1697]
MNQAKVLMKNKRVILSFIFITICASVGIIAYIFLHQKHLSPPSIESIMAKYEHLSPTQWGEHLEGITSLLPDKNKPVVYLTFDACGGAYDKALIDYLIAHNIQATLFINARWIRKHREDFLLLAHNPLFSIQNHGTNHRPLSVNGKSIYHIKGTDSVRGVYEEIMDNDRLIFTLTGKRAHYFRSGTAYYDEIAIHIAKDLGYKIGGFDVLGDGGATFSKEKIIKQVQKVRNGSILIYHFNKPQSDTFAGIQEVVPLLLEKGYHFSKL